jgi:hypothetical protein
MFWSHPQDGRFYLAVTAGLVVLSLVAFRFAARPMVSSTVLFVLRAATLGILVLILLNPVRTEHVTHNGPPPSAAFVIDESRSMSLEAPTSRAQAVTALIDRGKALVSPEQRPRIQKYGFGRELYAIDNQEKVAHPPADETRLGRVLEQLLSRFERELPFGVFVFSDGRSTEAEALTELGPAYRAVGVPIHVVPVGAERIAGDVSVQNIDAPRDARPGTRVPVRVTVRSHGYAGKRTEVSIRSRTDLPTSALATLPIMLQDGEQAHELVIDASQAKGGLIIDVAPLRGEAIAANNVVPFQIARRDPKLRVIYMEGSPLPEYRYIHEALEEDPNITCVSMMADNMHAVHPNLYRINDQSHGFPTTRKELLSYDVIICSDIALGAFTPEQLAWTVELVGKHGGGFVMIGGNRSFGPGGWDQTVWDGLIPVDISVHTGGDSEFAIVPFKVNIPPQALGHPIWRIVDDPARNREILARMPAFTGAILIDRLKPAATLLGSSDRFLEGVDVTRARHDRRPIPPQRPRPNPPVFPVIFACQPFGRGRTFAMAPDSTWAWGTEWETSWGEGDNRYFRKFWRNVMYWLTENSDGSSRRLQVETDKVFYQPDEPIRITARVYDEGLAETDRYQLVARVHPPEDSDPTPLEPAATGLVPQLQDKIYRGTLTAPPAGADVENQGSTVRKLTLDVVAADGDEVAAKSSVDLQVIDDPAEFRDPRPDHAALGEIARQTRGQVIHTPEQLAGLLARDPNASARVVVTRSPLWDTPLLWVLVMGLLSAEWVVRRRKGLA